MIRYTMQEAFDKALFGVRSQGVPAVQVTDPNYSGASCRLRAGGLKCAIGWLIPDEAYRPELEAYGPQTQLAKAGVRIEGATGDFGEFLFELREAHDLASTTGCRNFLRHFEAAMRALATDYNLTYTPPGGQNV